MQRQMLNKFTSIPLMSSGQSIYWPLAFPVPDPSGQSTGHHMYLCWRFIQEAQYICRVAWEGSASKRLICRIKCQSSSLILKIVYFHQTMINNFEFQSEIWGDATCSLPLHTRPWQQRSTKVSDPSCLACQCRHPRPAESVSQWQR